MASSSASDLTSCIASAGLLARNTAARAAASTGPVNRIMVSSMASRADAPEERASEKLPGTILPRTTRTILSGQNRIAPAIFMSRRAENCKAGIGNVPSFYAPFMRRRMVPPALSGELRRSIDGLRPLMRQSSHAVGPPVLIHDGAAIGVELAPVVEQAMKYVVAIGNRRPAHPEGIADAGLTLLRCFGARDRAQKRRPRYDREQRKRLHRV